MARAMSKCSSGSHRERILLARLLAGMQRLVRKCLKRLEARVGFEPTNGGFADLSLGPLGYRATAVIITKLGNPPGGPDSLLRAKIPSFSRLLRGPSLPAKTAPTLPAASD